MKKKVLFFTLFIWFLMLGQLALAQYYEPMEPIPGNNGGTAAINNFPAYVQAIYKFFIWSVGIAALLMITIGGFMYFTSAGNNSKAEGGKKIIADALYGLVAVIFAWLILNTINPNLVNISIKSVGEMGNKQK